MDLRPFVAMAAGEVQGGVHDVMAGLDPAIHAFAQSTKNVDARDKPGHDDFS
ncbi:MULTISPECIES: hypothetical protein [Bradyrhizobium]|uniref:hypothetical protein n=1 Tax=Bradyrhizobium TaxID=374 RepID=UPI00041EF2CA|nr:MULTISPECIES: hypothetical protein [Bradyrhizobium]QOG16225.1 hypothetical protein FOM02_01535 [Bradyrhizobium sp. SEMIA]UFW49521.1 hypothetical protein BaraCB756_00035 [Bradyrhizobium arachidis]